MEPEEQQWSNGSWGFCRFDWWTYLAAIYNAPPGTVIPMGSDPREWLPKTKPSAAEVGLPEGFE